MRDSDLIIFALYILAGVGAWWITSRVTGRRLLLLLPLCVLGAFVGGIVAAILIAGPDTAPAKFQVVRIMGMFVGAALVGYLYPKVFKEPA